MRISISSSWKVSLLWRKSGWIFQIKLFLKLFLPDTRRFHWSSSKRASSQWCCSWADCAARKPYRRLAPPRKSCSDAGSPRPSLLAAAPANRAVCIFPPENFHLRYFFVNLKNASFYLSGKLKAFPFQILKNSHLFRSDRWELTDDDVNEELELLPEREGR